MLIRVGLTQRSSEKKMSMTPTLFLAGVILPAKIFFIQHVHTVLIAIRSKNSNGFGNNCINQVFFVMKKLSMVQNICTAGPPWPIFGRQGLHSGGHISGVPPPLSILQNLSKAYGALLTVATL